MSELTLREVCVKYNISRRAVQGYEKYQLVEPTGKTNRGYLLYDEHAQKKICQIKKLQDCGFRLSEIRTLYESNREKRKEMLQNRYACLLKEQERLAASAEWLAQLIAKL